jgi:hypothetical protein
MEEPLVAISYAVDDEVREANLRFGPRRRFQSGPWNADPKRRGALSSE